MIKGLLAKQNASNTDTIITTNASGNSAKTSTVKIAQNTASKTMKTASLTNKSSTSQNSKILDTEIDVDALDDSSKDNEGLMDMDDVPLKKERTGNTTGSDKGK